MNATRRFTMAQLAKLHRHRITVTADELKAQTHAARLAGLHSVTLRLPIGDARLIADALHDWARDRAAAAHTAAVHERKGRTP